MTEVALGSQTYRLVDRASKLAGLAFVAAGLEVGGATASGLVLAAIGTVCGLLTVFIHER